MFAVGFDAPSLCIGRAGLKRLRKIAVVGVVSGSAPSQNAARFTPLSALEVNVR